MHIKLNYYSNEYYELTLKIDLAEGRKEINQNIGKSEFEEFLPSKNLSNSFVPFLSRTNFGDVVVFQAEEQGSAEKKYYGMDADEKITIDEEGINYQTNN